AEAAKALYTLAVSNVVIPADAKFPLANMYPGLGDKLEGDMLRQYLQQVRQETAQRLVGVVYQDGAAGPSKWWLCFQKRYFMGKVMS
ncbi:subunit of the Arp2/3 complex, partial [Coemansia erecta]